MDQYRFLFKRPWGRRSEPKQSCLWLYFNNNIIAIALPLFATAGISAFSKTTAGHKPTQDNSAKQSVSHTTELQAFFEKHRKTMTRLAKILFNKGVKSADISSGYYEGDPIPDELKREFFTFITIVEAEMRLEAQIGIGKCRNRSPRK
jgi:hypothetical protein